MPFFSVIIPLHNKANYIVETLQSVLKQNFTDFEVVVVDDGSTDSSAQLVLEMANDKIIFIIQPNSGASVARIEGIKKARGKYMALLDADDLWMPNHLSELHHLISTFPNAILYCTNYQIKRNAHFITPAVFNFEFSNQPLIIKDFFRANVINYIPSSSSSAFKREDYLKLPGYNTALRTGQDIDLWVQFALHGKVAFSPAITMTYNFNDQGSLSNSDYNTDRFNFIYSYQEAEKNNPSLKFYLDVNRYALAIRYKFLGGNKKEINTLIQDIDRRNLNLKQKLTLHLPRTALIILRKIQQFFLRKNIYLTTFK